MRIIRAFVASLLLIFPLCGKASAAWSLVAHSVASDTTSATTPAVDTSGANLLVAVVTRYALAPGYAISDSKGNSWTQLTIASEDVSIYYVVNPTVGTGHTFTASASANLLGGVCFMAFSGSSPIAPFDVQSTATNIGSTSAQPGAITPSQSDSLIISGLGVNSTATGTFNVNSSFTKTDQYLQGVSGSAAYLIQTSAAAVNPTWTWTGGETAKWGAVIASFKSPSTAPLIFHPFP